MSHSSVQLFGSQMFTLSLTRSFSCLSNNLPTSTRPKPLVIPFLVIHTSRLIPPLFYENVRVYVYGIPWYEDVLWMVSYRSPERHISLITSIWSLRIYIRQPELQKSEACSKMYYILSLKLRIYVG
jgi:hypothetical protein